MQWFRREADASFEKAKNLYLGMLMDVKKRMDAGTGRECIASRCWKSQESLGFSTLELAFAVTSPFGAGTDTVRHPCPFDVLVRCLRDKMGQNRLRERSSSACVSVIV